MRKQVCESVSLLNEFVQGVALEKRARQGHMKQIKRWKAKKAARYMRTEMLSPETKRQSVNLSVLHLDCN